MPCDDERDDGLLRLRDLLEADEASVQLAVRRIEWIDLVAVLSVEPKSVVQRMRGGLGSRAGLLLMEDIELSTAALAATLPEAERRVDVVLRGLANSGCVTVPRLNIMSHAEMDRLLESDDGTFEPVPWDDPDPPAV